MIFTKIDIAKIRFPRQISRKIAFLVVSILAFLCVLTVNPVTLAISPSSLQSAKIVKCVSAGEGSISGLTINQVKHFKGRERENPQPIKQAICPKKEGQSSNLIIKRRPNSLIVNTKKSYASLKFYSDANASPGKELNAKSVAIEGSKGLGKFSFPCTVSGLAHVVYNPQNSPSKQLGSRDECIIQRQPNNQTRLSKSAKINSERVYVVSADQYSSMEANLNEKPRVSASKIFEFTIAASKSKSWKDELHNLKNASVSSFAEASPTVETDKPQVRYYCSAMADLGMPPGVRGRVWGVGISDNFDSNVFSQDDPCRQAIQNCEFTNRLKPGESGKPPGFTCSVVGEGEWTIDESKSAIVSLKCSGRSIDQYSKPVKSSEVDKTIKRLTAKAREEGEGSCSLNIHDADEVIVSPSPLAGSQPSAVTAESDGQIVVSVTVGIVDVQSTNPKTGKEEITPLQNQTCTYSPIEGLSCKDTREPLTKEKKDKIVNSEAFRSLPAISAFLPVLDDPFESYTMDGQRVRPNRCVGGTVRLPADWKLILNQKHLKLAQKHVQRKDQRLASAYVDQSLSLLKQKSSSVGNIFETEIKQYLSSNECQLVAIDTDDLAAISITKQVLDSEKPLNSLVEDRIQQLQTANSDIVQFVTDQNDQTNAITIEDQPTWKIPTRINLKSAFGETFVRRYKSPPIEDLPSIGAGQTRATGGQKGESVSLVHTSYLFKNRFAKQQNEYFVINFVTTPERMSQYQQSFQDILQSFRFLLPKV